MKHHVRLAGLLLGAAGLLGGCAMEVAGPGNGQEGAIGSESSAIVRPHTERETKINAKFSANQSLLISAIDNFTHIDTGSTGAHREYAGAGNNSAIYYSDNLDQAQIVLGLIRGQYLNIGAQTSVLGYPTTDELATRFGTGRYNFFEFGRILWKGGNPTAFEVHGAINAMYGKLGQEWGLLGYPLSNEYSSSSRRKNDMEFGEMYYTSTFGAWPVLLGNNPQNQLRNAGAPRILSGSVSDGVTGNRGCVHATGASFTPGKSVTVAVASPSGIQFSGTRATVRSDGSFTLDETTSCVDPVFGYSINGSSATNVTLFAFTNDGPSSAAAFLTFYGFARPDPKPL
jgi:hypothetical protein